MTRSPQSRATGYTFVASLVLCAGCSAGSPKDDAAPALRQVSHDPQNLGQIALGEVGNGPCPGDNKYITSNGSSCNDSTEWCADFVMWVWNQGGVPIGGLSPGAGSFPGYGSNNGTLHTDGGYQPQVGDAIVWNWDGNSYADHVEMVAAVNGDGSIVGVSGNGCNGVVCQDYPCNRVGECDSYSSGWAISAFVSPVGGGGGGGGGGGDACSGFGDGLYCGNDPNGGPAGDPNTLYQCAGGATVNTTACTGGCQVYSGSQDDACKPGGPPPPPPPGDACSSFSDGLYCGNDPNGGPAGDPNTLYQCARGVTVNTTACPSGCQTFPGAQDDACQ